MNEIIEPGHISESPEPVDQASEWRKGFEGQLSELLKRENVSLEEVIEVLFQKGILNRLAPLDRRAIALRREQRRPVYNEGRDDPALYEKLFYSVECAKESLEYSRDASWVNAWSRAFNAVSSKPELAKKLFGEVKPENQALQFLDRLQQRIAREYRANHGAQELTNEPIGKRAVFHGIPVVIAGCDQSGLIKLEAADEAGHISLYNYTNKGRGMNPADLFSSDFVYQE